MPSFVCRKYEEIMPPAIEEFVYITDDTYNKRQVLRMEHLILKVLGFDLSVPTPLTFITAMCVTNKLTDQTMFLAMVCIISYIYRFRLNILFHNFVMQMLL